MVNYSVKHKQVKDTLQSLQKEQGLEVVYRIEESIVNEFVPPSNIIEVGIEGRGVGSGYIIADIDGHEVKIKRKAFSRGLLMAAVNYNRSKSETQTIRHLWYRVWKNPLQSWVRFIQSHCPDWNPKDNLDSEPSDVINWLVENSNLMFQDLGIFDTSRKRVVRGVVSTDTIEPTRYIVVCEKDTLYEALEEHFRWNSVVSVYSAKGQSSAAAIECFLSETTNINIVSITDFDPSGLKIASALAEQIQKIKPSINVTQFRLDWQKEADLENVYEVKLKKTDKKPKSEWRQAVDECFPTKIKGKDSYNFGIELDVYETSELIKLTEIALKMAGMNEELASEIFRNQALRNVSSYAKSFINKNNPIGSVTAMISSLSSRLRWKRDDLSDEIYAADSLAYNEPIEETINAFTEEEIQEDIASDWESGMEFDMPSILKEDNVIDQCQLQLKVVLNSSSVDSEKMAKIETIKQKLTEIKDILDDF